MGGEIIVGILKANQWNPRTDFCWQEMGKREGVKGPEGVRGLCLAIMADINAGVHSGR